MFLKPVADAEKQPTIAMVEPTNSDQLISSTVLFNVDVIETTYDHLSPVNTAFSAMHNMQDNIAWTDSVMNWFSNLWAIIHPPLSTEQGV